MNNLICLIESVKNYPKLYINTVNNDEKDDTKEWTTVAEKCKMPVANAQEQWNQLLMEYVEYLRSNQEFSLAKHMDFLQPYFFTIIDHQTIDEDELLNAIDTKKTDESNIIELNQIESKKGNSLHKEPIDAKIKIEQSKELDLGTSPTTFKQNYQDMSKDMSIKSPATPPNNSSSFTNLTSLELIFLGYAKQLQRMPLSVQLKTKRKIADIMDEAEIEMIS